MKFALSLAVLALAASQAVAVVPVPIDKCTKSVVVMPTDVGCVDFATRYGTTFENLLLWNTKLSPKCDNLDVGHPICVSITQGDCCLEKPLESIPPLLTSTISSGAVTTVTVTGTATAIATATTTATTTGSATVSVTTTITTATQSTAATTKPATATTSTEAKNNEAAGSKGSMMLAAAGVMLSVAYML
ncbi:hypothetical protein EDD21DRAFT_361117 [Dissophora ornata]|nr:hypothetical protein EDD21DRAFT_361117 [Dissophora ornata]